MSEGRVRDRRDVRSREDVSQHRLACLVVIIPVTCGHDGLGGLGVWQLLKEASRTAFMSELCLERDHVFSSLRRVKNALKLPTHIGRP